MGLVNYNEIDFNKSIDKTNKVINFNGIEIQIINYLSAKDKYDLIMITLQKSLENGIYNEFKLKQYFNLHLIYMYTNIWFTMEDRTDEFAIIDAFERSGLLNEIVNNIDEKDSLWECLLTVKKSLQDYQLSMYGFLNEMLDELKNKASEGMNLLSQLNSGELQQLMNTIKAASSNVSNLENSESLEDSATE